MALITKVDPTTDLARIDTRATVDSETSNCGATGTKDSGISKNLYAKYLFLVPFLIFQI